MSCFVRIFLSVFSHIHIARSELVVPCEFHNYRSYGENGNGYPHRSVLPDDNADWNYVEGKLPYNTDYHVERVTPEVCVGLEVRVFFQQALIDGLPEAPGTDRAIETFEDFIFFRRRLKAGGDRCGSAEDYDKRKYQQRLRQQGQGRMQRYD